MMYDVKILQGIAELTLNWEHYRERFFSFACEESGDSRWMQADFREHMYREYVRPDAPIASRFYSLDQRNRQTLLQFIDEVVMAGMASIEVELPDNIN